MITVVTDVRDVQMNTMNNGRTSYRLGFDGTSKVPSHDHQGLVAGGWPTLYAICGLHDIRVKSPSLVNGEAYWVTRVPHHGGERLVEHSLQRFGGVG